MNAYIRPEHLGFVIRSQTMELYLFPFIKAFLAAIILLVVFSACAKKFRLICKGRKSKRHIHYPQVSRLGGPALIIAFALAVLTDPSLVISMRLWGIFGAVCMIFIVGIWDDYRELDWKSQLFFQVAIVILIFITGTRIDYITNPFGGYIFLNLGAYLLPSLLLTFFWVLLLMNAVNWLDGLDGLSGGAAFIGAATIFLLSMKPEVNQPPVGIITAALGGATLAFLIYNFYPAKIFAGTAGSMFMGFILAALGIFAGTKIATALLVMAIPIIDTIWVIWERFRAGEAIYKPDKRHLHFKLLELGWSQRKITLFFYTVTILIAVIALNTRAIGKLVTIALVAVIMTGALIVINRKIASLRERITQEQESHEEARD